MRRSVWTIPSSAIALLGCMLLGAGCGGKSTAPKPSITGSWMGSTSTETFVAALSQGGEKVAGNVSVTTTSSVDRWTASGTYVAPYFSLTFDSADGSTTLYYSGVLQGSDTLSGMLTAPGYNGVTFVMLRQ